MTLGKNSRSARRATRGAVLVEYALILTFVAMPAVLGTFAGAVLLTKNYTDQRTRILLPYP
jgi:hypothetical protein